MNNVVSLTDLRARKKPPAADVEPTLSQEERMALVDEIKESIARWVKLWPELELRVGPQNPESKTPR